MKEGKVKKGGVNRVYGIAQRPPDPPPMRPVTMTVTLMVDADADGQAQEKAREMVNGVVGLMDRHERLREAARAVFAEWDDDLDGRITVGVMERLRAALDEEGTK